MKLDSYFTSTIIEIKDFVVQNDTRKARFLAQQLIAEFGTHAITSVDAGVILIHEDHVVSSYFKDSTKRKHDAQGSVKFDLFETLKIKLSGSFDFKSNRNEINEYHKARKDTKTKAIGPELDLNDFTLFSVARTQRRISQNS